MEVGEDGFDCVGGVALGFVRSLTVAFSRGDWFLAETVVFSLCRVCCFFSQIVAFFLAEIGFSQRPRRNRDYLVDGAVIVIAGSKWRWQPIIVAMVIYYFGYVSSQFLKIEMVVSRGDLSSRRPLLFLAEIGFSQRPQRNRDYLVDGAVIFIAGSKRRWQPIIVAMATYYFGYVSSQFHKIERSIRAEI